MALATSEKALEAHARRVWRFERFMARRRDVFPRELRMLWEVGDAPHGLAHGQLSERLGISSSHVSRMARLLVAKGLISSSRATHDQRVKQYEATAAGRRAWADLQNSQIDAIRRTLARMNPIYRSNLIAAMCSIEAIVSGQMPEPWSEVVVRPLLPGDLGWAIGRVGELQPEREEGLARALVGARGWIAETGGQRSGGVFVGDGQVRLLFVDPDAYGVRIREQLLDQANAFLRYTAPELAR